MKIAKKPKSKIAKGKYLEKLVAQEIEKAGLGKSMRTPGSGSGLKKGDIFSSLDWLIEVKNQEKINWWASIEQAKKQAEIGNYSKEKWALVLRDIKSPQVNPKLYCVIDFWQWLNLLKSESEPRIKSPYKNLRWKLETLKNTINSVLKELK